MREVSPQDPIALLIMLICPQSLLQAGILEVLCEHAHSNNPGLRLNAIWALKHLVDGADNELKKQALEVLEPGHLVRLIDDTEEDTLQSTQDADDDEDMEETGSEEFGSASRAMAPRLQRAKRKVSLLREAELNPSRKARNDDLAVQEQGLHFIRNLICLPSSKGEMVDHIFAEIGQDRFFQILSSKLRLKVLRPFGRRNTTAPETRVLYPQAKVIEAVVYVLVNIAASVPRHRQLVMAQTELLQLLSAQMSSRDTEVRRALCHLMSNLGERDEDALGLGEQRALELRRLGILAQLEDFQEKDSDLDVRETAKAAVWRIKTTTPPDV
jgi:hypothetical protein